MAQDIVSKAKTVTSPDVYSDLDLFLYEKIGYDKLSRIVQGVFISAYAPTSLQEYFATGFTEYYLNSNHDFLKKVSPQLYKKLSLLHNPEKLNNITWQLYVMWL